MKNLISVVCAAIWVAGVVIAKGFWSTIFAVFVPFWAFYLVMEKALVMAGWL